MEKSITISPDGSVRFIHDDELSQELEEVVGMPVKRRASHVEPVNAVARVIYHAIRKRVSDDSTAAEWTRVWPVVWRARIFGGPTLGPFKDRAEAIRAEVVWLEENIL